MSFNHVIDLVARQQNIPHWLAQGIAADVALSQALRAERRQCEQDDPRKQRLLLAALLDKKERKQ